MKKKTKVYLALLTMAICLIGIGKGALITANANSYGKVTVIDKDYTGKELPDLDTLFMGEYSTDATVRSSAIAVSPTPIPSIEQRTVEAENEVISITEEYVVNNQNVTVEIKYGKDLEPVEVPENFTVSDPVTLYATDVPPATRASYDPDTLVLQKQYYVDGDLAAIVTASYEVWYYTDGKVYLYSRTFEKATAAGYGSSYYKYGSIVNTDGTVSYTKGDYFYLIGNGVDDEKEIHFLVTSTGYDFY